MNKTDLSLVSMEEILEEVNRRYDMWIFSGMQLRKGKGNDILTSRKWQGNSAACMGLASQMQIAIYDTMCEGAEEDNSTFEINMPFKSKKQMKFMFAKHPTIAKRWVKKYGINNLKKGK